MSRKTMRLPNGYGSVYKLSGNRRNPWAVRKTVGWDDRGFPVYKFVGYYRTRAEALNSLALYNSDPYPLEGITLYELYELWMAEYKVNGKGWKRYQSVFKVCEPLYERRVDELRLNDYQRVFDDSGKHSPTLIGAKSALGLMYSYAIKHEMLKPGKRDIIKYINISDNNPNKVERRVFTDEEIDQLWKDNNIYPIVLIYTGMRVSELYNLKCCDVDLEHRYFDIVQSKTEAGVRRVPIAEKIVPIFREQLKSGSEYMFPNQHGNKYRDSVFRPKWNAFGHTPHDARHTLISILRNKGVDKSIVQAIVGHKGEDVTDVVYTHISLEAKLEAINKV